jgi:DDE_Tnp_1-associated
LNRQKKKRSLKSKMRAIAKFLNVMVTLIEDLKKIKDFRSPQGQRHPLWIVLLIVIWGTMAGYIGYRALGDFAKFNREVIRKTLKLHFCAVPSYSTIRRVMTGVKPEDLNQMFNQWASQLSSQTSELDWLAIDGKSLKSTVTNFHNSSQNFVSVVSAFNIENSCCVWGTFFENKLTSEIKQVQDIIEHLPARRQVFTLDALHCQKPTVNRSVETKNHYLIALKKHQKTLYNSLVELSETQPPQSFVSQKDFGHGRFHYPRSICF